MSKEDEIGRVSAERQEQGVSFDDASEMSAGMLTKQDEILAKLNEVLAAIDGAADGDALNTALNGLDLSALKKVKLLR